jgi:hypothetical protein
MPSGSWSRDVSTKTVLFVLALAAALSPAAAFAWPLENPVVIAAQDPGITAPAPAAAFDTLRASTAAQASDPTTPPVAEPPRAAPERKPTSARKALMLSLLLPGAGELYSGHKGRATGFFISEGAIWANFVVWQIAGKLRKDDYIEQAQLNAGIGTDSGSDDYWRLVGTYPSSSGSGSSYEDDLRRDARNEFPDDPVAQDAWVAERLPTGDRAWSWTSAALMDNYSRTRQNSRRAYSRAKLSFALAILNRVGSAIDTQILHRGDAKNEQSAIDGGFRILTDLTADGGGRIVLRQTF